jgi:hypothetical protein
VLCSLRQALEDNFRISQIQRRGRVYGGFVLAAGGEIGEESWLHVEIQGWWKWAEMSYMPLVAASDRWVKASYRPLMIAHISCPMRHRFSELHAVGHGAAAAAE